MLNLEGRELGGCKLLRKIGAGGMGEVYLAEQLRVGNRHVAVKVVSPEDSSFSKQVADDLTRRFQREAALLGQLSHPNILPVHDSGVEQSLLYMVMEYVPDGSLADAIRGVGPRRLALPLSLPLAVDYVSQVAAALQYTHARGIVHRDVKPGNVLVRVEANGHWHLLLADFGVARGIDNTSQRTQVTGTFVYMAPEQFDAKFSPASDQYALGVMAFQLLAGRTPFEGDLGALTRAHMFSPPPSLHALNPAVPLAVEAVIARTLAKNPAERYPTVAEFALALAQAAGVEASLEVSANATPAPLSPATAAVPAAPVGTRAAAHDAGSTSPLPPAWRPASEAKTTSGRGGAGRIGIALLVAAALLLGVFAVTGVLHLPGSTGPGLQATATSTTPATPIAAVPECTVALRTTDDATCEPPPPVAVGAPLIADAVPLCDQSGTAWQVTDSTTTACGDGVLAVTTKASNTLACVDAMQLATSNGYASVRVTAGTGAAAIGFRQGSGSSGGAGISGYYFGAYQTDGAYQRYQLDAITAPNPSTTLLPGAFPGPLATHFVLGVLYQGNSVTLYVNGVKLATTQASQFGAGYFGVCTTGSASFQDARVYPLA